MNKPLISIITPVYKVEPYIFDYLDSVLNQTYTNLEIICVNDGSPDRCGEILNEHAKKDARLLVIHQNNAGYSNAINRGLDNATGDYIGFIDPDDWAELDYYEKAVNLAVNTRADIVITNFYREYADKSEKMENQRPIPPVFEEKNEAFRFGFESDIYRGFKMFVWNKLYRSVFFTAKEKGGLRFRMDPSIAIGGDPLINAQCFLFANRFAYTPKAFYHYRIREASLMRSDFSKRLGFLNAMEQIVELLEKEKLEESVIRLAKRFHTYYCSQLAEFAHSVGDKKNLDFSKTLVKKYLNEYILMSAEHPDRLDRIHRILQMDC